MEDKIVIAVVVAIVLGIHAWLYVWIRFKMDEGAIIKFLQDSNGETAHSSEGISSCINIAPARVSVVCSKSKTIQKRVDGENVWFIN